jgi:hypothetical protein
VVCAWTVNAAQAAERLALIMIRGVDFGADDIGMCGMLEHGVAHKAPLTEAAVVTIRARRLE